MSHAFLDELHYNRFTALFPGPPGWAGARRELLDFMVQGKINRGRHTDHPAGCHFIRSNQRPPPPSPHRRRDGTKSIESWLLSCVCNELKLLEVAGWWCIAAGMVWMADSAEGEDHQDTADSAGLLTLLTQAPPLSHYYTDTHDTHAPQRRLVVHGCIMTEHVSRV